MIVCLCVDVLSALPIKSVVVTLH